MILFSAHLDSISDTLNASDLVKSLSSVPFTIAAIQEVTLAAFGELLPILESRGGYRSVFSPYGCHRVVGNVGMLLIWDSNLCALKRLEHDKAPLSCGTLFRKAERASNLAQIATFEHHGQIVQVVNYRVPVLAPDTVPLDRAEPDPQSHVFLCLSGLHDPDNTSMQLSAHNYVNACVCGDAQVDPGTEAIYFRGLERMAQFTYLEHVTESGLKYRRLEWAAA